MNKIINKNKGFTLIELLIVISIIGVLASLLMTNCIGVRQRARDAQRKTDVRQIQSALEMYRADAGTYPLDISLGEIAYDENTYMNTVPEDPSGVDYYNSGEYCYDSTDGTRYYIVACLENGNDSQGTATITDANCPTTNCSSGLYYLVTNP